MTLKQAFTSWSMIPGNIVLAAKSRDAVNKVLMKRYADVELEQVTELFASRLFKKSNETQEFKTQAASILVYLLEWGASKGYCIAPSFNRSVALPGYMLSEETVQQLSKEMKQEHQLMKDDMEQTKNVGRAMRPVVQIDKETLEVIKIWPAITTAASKLKIQNIDRAIQRGGIAGGFFWCDEADLPNFKPGRRGEKPSEEVCKAEKKPKKEDILSQQAEAKPKPSNEDIEFPPRKPTNKELEVLRNPLSVYTDDELVNELIARGFRGEIQKMIVIELK